MKLIQGHNRTQINLFPVSIDQSIDPDNEVRMIDLFVDSLSIKEYGFRTDFIENGRPAYHHSDLLKLFIYLYMNKVRPTRDLEKECKRNIEVMWLLKWLRPDHNTIGNFRKDNHKAIKKVFRSTVQIAKHFDLISGELIAGDSTKLRAQNSKKNNYNQAKIDRHVAYIDNKLEEYAKALAENDGDNKQLITDEIARQQNRKEQYKEFEKEINESGELQISTSDPESRQIMVRNNITEVAYSVQTTVAIPGLPSTSQVIVEHPFGTMKRQWGLSNILTKKGINWASADAGFMFIAYNLRRIGNILIHDRLKEYLRILVSVFLTKKSHSRLKNIFLATSYFWLSVLNRKSHGSLVMS